MPFCHDCGIRVSSEDVFCSECGTALQSQTSCAEPMEVTHHTYQSNIWGYIFTNIVALCSKLRTTSDCVRQIISRYIDARGKMCNYILIDASNYIYCGSGTRVSLSSHDSWLEYQRLITDRYNYDTHKLGRAVEYLFIIGGDDVIPMARVGAHMREECGVSYVEKVDSDLPYGALYGEKTDEMLVDMSLCQMPHMMFVGRLPMGNDATIASLSASLNRMAMVGSNGLHIKDFYAQCDPHWSGASYCVVGDLLSLSGRNDEVYHYKGLTLTPFVVSAREYEMSNDSRISPLSDHFDEHANLCYFNLHGSNAPRSSGFYGEELVKGARGAMFEGISPNDVLQLKELNIIVTEACYGARFINKSSEQSMLLSAFENKTVVYVGSSRIAYGSSTKMTSADIIAHHFIKSICSGYTVGEAMHLARTALVKSDNLQSELTHVAIAEFNLFGDPSLSIAKKSLTAKFTKVYPRSVMYKDNSVKKVNHKRIYDQTKHSDLRAVVEGMVNMSLLESHKLISQYLYDYYYITPRPVSFIVMNSIENRCISYSYHYCDNNNDVVVELDTDKNIKRVLTSK